jgi:hypothetical protein
VVVPPAESAAHEGNVRRAIVVDPDGRRVELLGRHTVAPGEPAAP